MLEPYRKEAGMNTVLRENAAAERIADDTTPFVFNCWYIAARSEELGDAFTERMLLGRSVLMYRRKDGVPVAMQNRCPHRSAPLSLGRREGDSVICAYHGMTFDDTGACTAIPSQPAIPAGCHLRGYAVVERGPFVWIWMGDKGAADPAGIPDHAWLQDPAFGHVEGYFHVGANYLHLQENVLDLTHVPFLHGTHNATVQFADGAADVQVDGDTIRSHRSEFNRTAPPHYAASIGCGERTVHRHSTSWFLSPAFHTALTRIEQADPQPGERRDSFFRIIHAFTPETQHSTHYFWSNARDTSIDSNEIADVVRARSSKVYYEDVVVLEAAEKLRINEPAFREISVAADRSGIQMRRIVARLAAHDA
jgi:phenylpropionate dioxygenase-like ring-hydroxylating dioxygenase large terminal subunit